MLMQVPYGAPPRRQPLILNDFFGQSSHPTFGGIAMTITRFWLEASTCRAISVATCFSVFILKCASHR